MTCYHACLNIKPSIPFSPSVSKQVANKISKVSSEYEAIIRLQEKKYDERLRIAQSEVSKEKVKWNVQNEKLKERVNKDKLKWHEQNEKLKERLRSALDKVTNEKEKWQEKESKLRQELDLSSDRVYREKRKRWYAISKQVMKSKVKEAEMQNYLDGLNDKNIDLADSLSEALQAKRKAKQSTWKARSLADCKFVEVT